MRGLAIRVVIFCVCSFGQLSAQAVASHGNPPLSFESNAGQADRSALFLARTSAADVALKTNGAAVLKTHGLGRTRAITIALQGARNTAALPSAEDELAGKVNYLIGNDPAHWRIGLPTFSKVRYRDVYKGIDLIYYGTQRQIEYDFVVAPGADPQSIRMQFDGIAQPHVALNGDLVASTPDGTFALQRPVIYQEVEGARKAIAGHFTISGRAAGFHVGTYDHRKPLVIDPVLIFSTYLGGSVADTANAIAVDTAGNIYVAGATLSPDFPTVAALQSTPKGSTFSVAFVSKLNSAGTAPIYSTYVGGTGGDAAYGLAVDASGAAYIVGETASKDFPVTAGALQTTLPSTKTSFVAKLNPAGGGLAYATYLGGASAVSYLCCDAAGAVVVDTPGNAYVAGTTYSSGFPVTPGALQTKIGSSLASNAYVAKLNPSGSSLVYATFLGGRGQGAFSIGPAVFEGDVATAIAVDLGGNVYVAGYAHSPDFPVTAGAFQGKNKAATTQGTNSPIPGYNTFVSKINPAGSALVYSTYLGGSGISIPNGSIGGNTTYLGDQANALAVDNTGNAYVAGYAYSPDFPVTAGAYQTKILASQTTVQPVNFARIGHNAFVTKLNSGGSGLVYSTFVGGTGSDKVNGMAIDASGNAYITGDTTSIDFPVSAGAFQPVNKADIANVPAVGNTATTVFFTKLNSTGSALAYSTFLGGTGALTSNNRQAGESGQAITVDAVLNVYVAGTTWSADFPTTSGAFQTTDNAAASKGQTAFVAKINPSGSAAGDPPSIRPNLGVVDAAGFGPVLTPGSLATVFGYSLANASANASSLPLTNILSGTQVMIGGIAAPPLYVSPAQINFQVPWELAGQSQATVVVRTPLGVSTAQSVSLSSAAPGLFAANGSGNGQADVVTLDGNIATTATPATRGKFVMIYCTGLGAVSNQPATGTAVTDGSSPTIKTPTVTMGGLPATVSFAGLAPGYVGVYQINVVVPGAVTPGLAVPLSLSVDGASSRTLTLAVQ